MNRNPKKTAGIIGIAVLLTGLIVLLVLDIPMAQEVAREMSLTPTPEPPVPGSVMAVTPDPSLPTSAPVLRSGSRGEEVESLQIRLKDLGYYQGEIDGQFGGGTKEAVTAFQKANGLNADGIVGEETKTLLFSPYAKPNSGSGNQ